MIRSILKYATQVRAPTLVLQGDSDNTVAMEAASRLLVSLASTDKELKLFKRADHNFYDALPPRSASMYEDSARKQDYDVISDWLRRH